MIESSHKAAAGGRGIALSAVLTSLFLGGGCTPLQIDDDDYDATDYGAYGCEEDLRSFWCEASCVFDGTCSELVRSGDDVGQHAQASSSRMAINDDDSHAAVVLEDRHEVVLVALEDHSVVQRVSLPENGPHRVTSLGTRGFAVSLKRSGEVAVFGPQLDERGRVAVGSSPFGLLPLEDGKVLVAVSGDDALVEIDVEALTVERQLKLTARDPRGITRRADGRLVVAHFSPGRLTVLEPDTFDVVAVVAPDDSELGRANHLEKVIASPGDGQLHVVMQLCNDDPARFTEGQSFASTDEPPPPSAYYTGGLTGSPAVVGTTTRVDVMVHDDGATHLDTEHDVYNPLVSFPAHVGAADMALLDDERAAIVVHMLSGTANLRDREQPDPLWEGAFEVGVGADTVVVSGDGQRAWVFNPFTRELFAYELGYLGNTAGQAIVRMQHVQTATLGDEVLDERVARGRELFHSVNDWMTVGHAIACASCHPGGQDDGITWQFEQGPRQTQPLWGDVFASGAVHWDLEVDDLAGLSEVTIEGRMGGQGLQGLERAALGAFLAQIPVPAPPSDLNPLAVERGQALFNDPILGCTDCHTGPRLRDGLAHDVGTSAGSLERETLEAIATPTLLGIGASAPYLHDGSAPTLLDVIDVYVRTDRMGTGSHLTDADAADLVAYLKSL